MAAWRCAICGGANPAGMRFCGHCGAANPDHVEAAPTEIAAAAPSVPGTGAGAALGSAVRRYVSDEAASRFAATQPAFAEDHRLITALFADISGFTALAQRVDTEELLEIIDPLVARLGAVVARYEGTVEKYAGDAILAVFGAPAAHDDDAARALLVALEMHRELARAVPELGPGAEGLTLHVGVNSGHAIARVMGSEARLDYGVLGDAVIVAQRLESQAPGGETYVGASTVALVGDRFELESIGGLTMKGKAEPVPAWRLIGEAGAIRGVGTPAAAADGDAFVGRVAEVDRIERLLDACRSGVGGLLTITGEPGVGKSSLVRRTEEFASGRGTEWFATRCASYGQAVTYGPFASLVREWAEIRIEDPSDDVRERLVLATDRAGLTTERPLLGRLLGLADAADDDATLGPEAFQRALHQAFLSWLASAGRSPRVLLIEDVQWIDQASRALTEELAGAAAATGLLVILTGRPEAGAMLVELADGPGVQAASIVLRPFDAHDTANLVERELQGTPSPALVAFVHDRTAGNPFFIRETVRALQEAGALAGGANGIGLVQVGDARTVPPTIEGVLAARIDRLPVRERDVLLVASVIGRRVREPLLEAVVDDRSGLDDVVGRLVETGLVDRLDDGDDAVTFHHALVQDVAYGRLLRRRRRELHGRAADAIERLYGIDDDVIDDLARHLYLARAGVRAVEALLRVADRAAGLFANDEAILALERAAELLAVPDPAADDAAGLHDVRLRAAELQERTGRYDRALAGYRSVVDATGAPRAWLGIARTHRSLGDYEAALKAVDAALSRLPSDADPRPFLLERARTLSQTGRLEDAVAAAREGIESRPGDDAAVRGHLLVQLARARTVAGAAEEAIGYARDAVAILEREHDVPGLATGYRTLGYALSKAGRQDEAERALLRALGSAERTGSSDEIGGTLINLGVVAMYRGQASEAADRDRRAIAEFERIGHGSGRVTAYANLAHALAEMGDLDEAAETAERASALARHLGHALALADAVDTLSSIARRRGDTRAAASLAQEAGSAYVAAGAITRAVEAYEQAAAWWRELGELASASSATSEATALTSTR